MKSLLCVAAIAAGSSLASAGIVDGSSFTTSLGLGNTTAGFFGLGNTNPVINGAGGSYITPATGTPVSVTATMVDNGFGFNDILTITFESTNGGDLYPAGLATSTSGLLDLIAQFAGANSGGTPVVTDGPTNWVSLSYEVFIANASAAVIPVTISGAFTGSFGVNLGANTGLGINKLVVTVVVDNIPTPGSLALLGAAGMMAARRRRA